LTRTAVASVAVAALVGMTACSAPDEDNNDSGSSVAAEEGAFPVTIEQNYKAVTIDSEPSTIATLGPGDADILLALGITPATMVPFSDPEAKRVVEPWNEELIGDSQPVVLGNASANLGEEIPKALATNPDLIVAVNNTVSEEQFNNLTKVAPTVVRGTEFKDWQVPWDASTAEIGKAVGQPEATEKLIAETKAKFDEAQEKYPNMVGKKSAVIVGGADGSVYVYGPGDGRGQTLVSLGQVFPDEFKPLLGDNFYGSISSENLNMLNALDTAVVVDWSGSSDQLKSNPVFANLDIVKRGDVVYVDQLTGSAMSVPTVLTIPWVIDRLAPELNK
jgi:iron complex transport system substrate-binding protein